VRAKLLVDANGGAGITLEDKWGHPRVALNVAPDGDSMIAIIDENGDPVEELSS
jgi:hypothetical protein